MERLSDAELGWLAGIFDGEGCVGINRYPDGYYSSAKVAMTHRETIERVANLMGRVTGVRNQPHPHKVQDEEKHKPQWFVESKHRGRVATLGRVLLPFSVTKRVHWLLVIEWDEHRSDAPRTFAGHSSYDGSEVAFYERSRVLNRKGPMRAAA